MFALPRLFLLMAIVWFALGCSSTFKEVNQEASAAPVFNVPALFGKDIDQVASALGRPEWDSVSSDAAESIRLFRRDTVLLRVGYAAPTRKVHSFLIQSAHAQTGDYRSLLRLVNLTGSEPVLVVVPLVSNTNSGRYSGVKVFVKDGAGL
ncbi:hypothetical protein ACFST9_14645 [Hymenobacter monticola]|uniref:Uncharacterized protein n=1 Tax=Hymenobacter monticola TaxID=1705399 RepID=A0ABY4BBY1_9BACT|nr:hypothetical protein [Hymenobacter monticola]UOE36648.1 hypothetical protein MTP16_25050 [Hymenobacter monticola]